MPSLRNCKSFISHAWNYNDDYYRCEKFLNDAAHFDWTNLTGASSETAYLSQLTQLQTRLEQVRSGTVSSLMRYWKRLGEHESRLTEITPTTVEISSEDSAPSNITMLLSTWALKDGLRRILDSRKDILRHLLHQLVAPKWIVDVIINNSDMLKVKRHIVLI